MSKIIECTNLTKERRIKTSSGVWWDAGSVLCEYFSEETDGDYRYNGSSAVKNGYLPNFDNLFNGGDVMILVVFVMIFAACVAIVNAFNSNLKDRKQQIGMMRAVGATKRQIINIYGREAFIISLIVTPISVLLSYFLVRLTLNIISDEAVMSKSLAALPIAAVTNVIVVMLASFVPLKSASRITPMQAIRNIANNRKAKTKKIKSKKQFDTSKLWAKRSLSFYKGSHITVSIILAATVLFTCISTSSISYSRQNLRTLPYDFVLNCFPDYQSNTLNEENQGGFTASEFQQVLAKPYVSDVSGEKCAVTNLIVDEYNDYLNVMASDAIVSRQERYDRIKNAEEYKEAFKYGVENGVLFKQYDEWYNSYPDDKKALGVEASKEIYSFYISAADEKEIRELEDKLVAGKIDYNKLSSGEEVIMIAPQKYKILMKFYRNGGRGWMDAEDDEADLIEPGYKTVLYAECPYKVGDTLELVTAVSNTRYSNDEKADTTIKSITRRTVKIGAIITPDAVRRSSSTPFMSSFGIATTNQGLDYFCQGRNYYSLNINCAIELDEESNLEITDDLSYFKGSDENRWLNSNFEDIEYQKNQLTTIIAAMISVTIIGFAICVSIINNSLSSRIRESKKVIGMLRTVGADTRTLVKSFIMQMLSMFGWGAGIGYGLYIIVYLGIRFTSVLMIHEEFNLNFSPWFALIMTAIMFIICSVNLWSRIKKEMKYSIIDNIKEL